MLPLLLLVCLAHLSVGDKVTGNILLNGNPSLTASLPAGSQVVVEIRDTAMSDAPAPLVARIQFSATALPVTYEIPYTPDVPPSPFYSLLARISCPDILCYINENRVPLTVEEDGISSVDIPVRAIQ